MTGESPRQTQRDLFQPLLIDFIDRKHELVLPANKIDWTYFEKSFAGYYSNTGQPVLPIHLMVGCLVLKRIYNLGDETLAQAWVMNPYMQYFCGYAHFNHRFPCDPSDFVHFRKRIGQEGISLIFNTRSIYVANRTVEWKYLTLPSRKTTLAGGVPHFLLTLNWPKRIIDKCNGIATNLGVVQRQTYRRISKQLV